MLRTAARQALLSLTLLCSLTVTPAAAGMIGNTLTMTLGSTGNTTTAYYFRPATNLIGTGPDEFGFCVNIATPACGQGSLKGWVDVSDTGFRFDFRDATNMGATGSFTLTFTGFTQPVVGVSLTDSVANMTEGFLGLTATSTATSITFTGTPSRRVGDYYSGQIAYATFAVEQAAPSVPDTGSSMMLLGIAMTAAGAVRRRWKA